MSGSIRNQIITALIGKLEGAEKPAGVNVRRMSPQQIPTALLPMIEVHPGKDVPTDQKKGVPAVKRTLRVLLDVYAQEAEASEEVPAVAIDEAIDPVLCWIISCTQEDQSLGGLALDVRVGEAEWDAEQAALGTGLCRQVVEIDYIHNRNNQETKP